MVFWRSAPPKIPVVPTDRILPVHYVDAALYPIQLFFLARFDDVLDAEKLRGALTRLLHRDGWRKLGARLRRNDKGKLELHVPAEFSAERPAIDYHHERFSGSISSHPLASQLPKASGPGKLSVLDCCNGSTQLLCQDGDPRGLKDYLNSDRPLLGLRIVNFDDATLVTVNWSHASFDAMGLGSLFDAWSQVLQGRDDEVLPLHGVESDFMDSIGINPTETYLHADKKMSILTLLALGLRMFYERLVVKAKEEKHMICVPAAALQSLRDEALASIKAESKDGEKSATIFLSDGDLLTGWWTKLIARSMGVAPDTPVALHNGYSLRKMFANDLLPSGTAYMGNAISQVSSFFTVQELTGRPLGHVAAKIRKDIVETGTREQIDARTAIDRACVDKFGFPAFLGTNSRVQTLICTNWSKGNFFDIDFSAALVEKVRDGSGDEQRGRVSWVQPLFLVPEDLFNNLVTGFVIVGKDRYNNHWVQAQLSRERWVRVQPFLPNQGQDSDGAAGASKGGAGVNVSIEPVNSSRQ